MYPVSKPVDMRERELWDVCLMCSIVNKRIEIVTKLYWNQKHESDGLNAVESCIELLVVLDPNGSSLLLFLNSYISN